MAQGLGDLEGYRMPAVDAARHDAARWEYGGSWLQTLNTGGPDEGYANTTRRVDRPDAPLQRLPFAARRAIEQAYSTIEIADSIAQTGGEQVGRIREYSRHLQQAIRQLEGDVLNSSAPHEMTAILDKVAAGELLGRRHDTAANQLLSHVLEQLLVRSKRERDAEAAAMNMRLGGLRDGRAAGASVVRGAADDLRAWRQP
jgi:hypothetical protein